MNAKTVREDRARRSVRRPALTCEALEGRVVLAFGGFMGPMMPLGGGFVSPPVLGGGFGASGMPGMASGAVVLSGVSGPAVGGGLSGALAAIGIVNDDGGMTLSRLGQSNTDPTLAQLQTDQQQLQTDLQAVSNGSGVTVADLAAINADEQALAKDGFALDPAALQKVVSNLASAIASAASTTTPDQTAFNALFTSPTTAQQADIDKAFTDLVKIITDSHVTTSELQAIATDQTNIRKDMANLPGGGGVADGPASLTGSLANLGIATTSSTAVGQPVVQAIGGGAGTFLSRMGGMGGMRSNRVYLTSQNALNTTTATATTAAVPSTQTTALNTDAQKLQTDQQTLAAKSGVTVADSKALKADDVAIAKTGVLLDAAALKNVENEIVTAVNNTTPDTTQAQSDFNALFANSGVPQATIDQAFTDLVKVITDSKVTPTDLATIAADQTALQADQANLKNTTPTTTTPTTPPPPTTTTPTTTTPTTNTTDAAAAQAAAWQNWLAYLKKHRKR